MPNCLSSRDIEVCYVRTGGDHEASLARLLPELTDDEQARAARFFFARDRLAFALARVLVRKTLSRFASAPPGGWQFVCNPYGKPDLQPFPGSPPIRFNISHCAGFVAAAVTLERDIGLDVETLDRSGADAEIARSYFAPDEVRFIESLPEERRRPAFLDFWTLKEAYIKARGMGLSIPLADFAFALDPIRIAFSPRIEDHAANWFFWQGRLSPAHDLAVAARRQPHEELTLRVREISLESLL